MPIIHGCQGNGKSFIIEMSGELLGVERFSKVAELDKVVGKFETLIGGHPVASLNEPEMAMKNFILQGRSRVNRWKTSIFGRRRAWIKSRVTVERTR
jgi:hypothetical protein